MKRTCSAAALLALGLWALYFAALRRWGDIPLAAAAMLALLCAIGGLLGLSMIPACVHFVRCLLALRRAGWQRAGAWGAGPPLAGGGTRPLRDGRFEAVAGPIAPLKPLEPLEDPEDAEDMENAEDAEGALLSPIAGEPCVLYKYEAFETFEGRHNRGRARHIGLVGAALTPCAVTSPRGTVTLRGLPRLDALKPHTQAYGALDDAAKGYFYETAFIRLPRTLQSFQAIQEALAGDCESLEYDWSVDGARADKRKVFEERSVGVGAEVCVFGRYSAENQSLGHGKRRTLFGSEMLQLFPGSLDDARRALRTSLLTSALMALLLLAVSHGFLALVLLNGPGR